MRDTKWKFKNVRPDHPQLLDFQFQQILEAQPSTLPA
jgi:hypothetical protein